MNRCSVHRAVAIGTQGLLSLSEWISYAICCAVIVSEVRANHDKMMNTGGAIKGSQRRHEAVAC